MGDRSKAASAILSGLLAATLAAPPASAAAEPQTPEAQTPEARTAEAQTPEARTARAQTPEARTAEAQTPEARTAEAIRAAIATAVQPRLAAYNKNAAVEVAVGAIDPRLRLPACATPQVTLPPVNAATMTAKVDCRTPVWTIYVPVRLHAWIDAIVASVNLAPNTRLDAGELTHGRVDMFANNGGLLTDAAQAEGKILRVGLLAGAPILSPFLEFPVIVHRGQKVLLTVTASTMTIEAPAMALEDGRIGDNIEVENPDSKKTMRATVLSDGNVEMRF